MDTNTIQTLITLLSQKAALAPAASVWQTGFGQLVPYLIAALMAITVWLNSKAAASAKSADTNSKLAVEKTVEGNKAVLEVDKKVNGAMEKLMALEHHRGMDNGRALERSEQAKSDKTVAAVKEAIKELAPPLD